MRLKSKQNQSLMALSPVSMVRGNAKATFPKDRPMQPSVQDWHEGTGRANHNEPEVLQTPTIERMLRLTLEEAPETVIQFGCTIVSDKTGEDIIKDSKLSPVEGKEQDLVEVAEGTINISAACALHAADHGIHLTQIFEEITLSYGTKLLIDGIDIVNECVSHQTSPTHDCNAANPQSVLLDPEAPIGNIPISVEFVQTDTPDVLWTQQRSDTNQTAFAFEDCDVGRD